jgi:hypothetical protein
VAIAGVAGNLAQTRSARDRNAQCHPAVLEGNMDQVQAMAGNLFKSHGIDVPDPMGGVNDRITLAERLGILRLDLGGGRYKGGRHHRRRHRCRRHAAHLKLLPLG